jgi:hypothetical protein
MTISAELPAGLRWSAYLSGEIHSDWRDRIADGVKQAGLPVDLLAVVEILGYAITK